MSAYGKLSDCGWCPV
ncbi:hypothetical protein D030_3102A, partial [Vibrio parahaemolyticus AQ3810]